MRLTHLTPALLLAAAVSQAATFSLNTNFDNTINDSLTAPYVGTFEITYTANSALTDGSYKWTSFQNGTMLAQLTHAGTTYSFTQANFRTTGQGAIMDPSKLYVQVVGSEFYFKMSDGSATWFENNGYTFTTEPVDLDSFSAHRDSNFDRAMYSFGTTAPLAGVANSLLFGNYGASSASGRLTGIGGGAIPEPSTYGLALGGLALAVVALRRRKKK